MLDVGLQIGLDEGALVNGLGRHIRLRQLSALGHIILVNRRHHLIAQGGRGGDLAIVLGSLGLGHQRMVVNGAVGILHVLKGELGGSVLGHHEVVAALGILIPQCALLAHGHGHLALRVPGQVVPQAQSRLGVVALGGDDPAVLVDGGTVNFAVGHRLHALFGGDGGQHNPVLLLLAGEVLQSGPAVVGADLVVLDLVGEHFGVLREALGINEAFGVQLMEELQILPVLGGVHGAGDLAVPDVEVGVSVAVAVANAPHADIVGDGGAPHVLGKAVGNLIRLAVAVGVLLLKGLKHFVVLVQRGGNFLVDRFQPFLVDDLDAVAGVLIQGLVPAQHAVNMAAGSGGNGSPVRTQLAVGLHAVGGKGLQHILQGDQLGLVLQNLSVGQQGPEHIGHVAAGQHQRNLLRGGARGQLGKLQGQAGLFGDVLKAGLLVIALGGVQHVPFFGDGQSHRLGDNGQNIAGVGAVDGLPGGLTGLAALFAAGCAAFRRAVLGLGRLGRGRALGAAAVAAGRERRGHHSQAQQQC